MNKEEILKSKTDIDNGIVSTYDYTIYEAMEEYANQFKVEPSPEQDKLWNGVGAIFNRVAEGNFSAYQNILDELKQKYTITFKT